MGLMGRMRKRIWFCLRHDFTPRCVGFRLARETRQAVVLPITACVALIVAALSLVTIVCLPLVIFLDAMRNALFRGAKVDRFMKDLKGK